MAKEKKSEPKIILERTYIVPLRNEWLKVGKHKRANRAITTLKQFIVRHMKIYDRDLRKVKIDLYLNNEMRFRGMRKPPASIKIIAKKYDNDIVKVELAEVPNYVRFKKLREEKKTKETKTTMKKEEVKETTKEENDNEKITTEKQEEAKEKEEASKEETLGLAKEQAKEQKHISKPQNSVEKNFGSRKSQKGR